MKDKLDKLTKNIGDLKNKAAKIGQDAAKAAGTVKEVVNVGVSQSKSVIEKAGKVVNKNAIGQGIEAASKGLELAANGAKIAANTFEKTASGMKQVSQKLKNKKNTD